MNVAAPDDIDRAILHELERNARISNKELAALVGIAPSTCHARVRNLIDNGTIVGFKAIIDSAKLPSRLDALISIRLHPHHRADLQHFQRFLQALPQARSVYFLAGERDFLVHVVVQDVSELRDLVSQTISVREEVAATNTSLVFEHVDGGRGGANPTRH